ncbi:flagellar hook-basal body complex protein [Bacillus mexicanus]|uniref:flagellar hook-basal body protein n=1 Tax=Bacillus mexicanus TaxID=2834415 RepID=UPI003D18FEFD
MANVYTSAMGMISFQNKLDVVGNNIANQKSNGYKKDHETFRVFEEGVQKMIEGNRQKTIGDYEEEVHSDNVQTNYDPGLLKVTNRNLDLALEDKTDLNGDSNVSFFEVEISGEKMLTRDGHFEIDEENNLTLLNGAYVLDTNGKHIKVPKGENVSVDSLGNIKSSETGRLLGSIQIRSIAQENTGYLKKTYGNMFQVMSLDEIQKNFGNVNEILRVFDDNPSLQKILKNKQVLQEAASTGQLNIFDGGGGKALVHSQTLEQSNVDITTEMNEMLLAQKGYQANAKALSTMDKINEKEANQIGV